MQQPAPTPPPAPIQPAPAPAPTAVVNLPDGPLPLEGLPRNAQELRGLRERREILRDQLERATNRRAQLVAQVDGDGPAALRVGTQQRLAMLDDRILQIERDQATTERLLANAPPNVLAQTSEPSRNMSGMVDEDGAIASAFGTFFFGIVLTLVFQRVRRGRARRRAGLKGAPAAASALADDPRFERLTQAVDAMAEEVERIGEGQRFVTQLLAERREPAALSAEPRR